VHDNNAKEIEDMDKCGHRFQREIKLPTPAMPMWYHLMIGVVGVMVVGIGYCIFLIVRETV